MTQCSICSDKNRKKIDAALVIEGATVRAIARQFGVGKDALLRHVKNGHVIKKIAQAQQAQDIVEADSLLNEIQEIHQHQKTIFQEERGKKGIDENTGKVVNKPNNRLALEALRDQSKIIELKGKILGSFNKDKPQGSILLSFDKEDRGL